MNELHTIEKMYSKLLSIDSVNTFCSKAYGFELFLMIYQNSISNSDYGIEDTFESLRNNKCTRPAFINFINYLEFQCIIYRKKSKIKKNKVLLRLHKPIIIEVKKIVD